MNKIKNIIKNNIGGFIVGIIITFVIGVSAATTLASSSVYYNNSTSGGSSTNVAGALDELYNLSDIRKKGNIVSAYTYNASTCVTGEESTCVPSTCHKSTAANSCKAGDIIKYKVNNTDIITFHVMYDNGATLTLQSQKNIINNTMWISAADYATENTDGTTCSSTACNDEGPMTVLVALERATKSWTNVNNQTYTMGTTSLSSKGSYTTCSSYNSCTTNLYTLNTRTSKARMITLQEAASFGCTGSSKSCPKWMNNYLSKSTSYGGTISDSTNDPATGTANNGYWTMSADSYAGYAWYVDYYGRVGSYDYAFSSYFGARAVVVVNK